MTNDNDVTDFQKYTERKVCGEVGLGDHLPLDEQHSDDLDFIEISRTTLRRVIEVAYHYGKNDGEDNDNLVLALHTLQNNPDGIKEEFDIDDKELKNWKKDILHKLEK
jgi:hypothetical protein|tara:strand:- start:751 stop:1074 length:324 start_codon:yes stop_codon:yes gene_type:complete